MKRKFLSVILSALMMLTIFTTIPTGEKILQPETALAVSCTADQAIEWCRGVVGQTIDMDNAYGGQCVDLYDWYLEKLGYNWKNYTVSKAADLTVKSMPSDWQRIQGAQPQKGDVLVYTKGYYDSDLGYCGHVAIYESDYVSYHQNFNGQYVEKITYKYNSIGSPQYWGVLRPNFVSPTPLPAPTEVRASVYNIKNVGSGYMMNYNWDSKYFDAWSADGSVEQTFQLVALGGNAYRVNIRHGDGGVMNCYANDGTYIGAGYKINRYDWTGDSTQKFYFRKVGTNQYVITSTYGDGVLTGSASEKQIITTASYQSGNKYQIWELTDLTPPVTTTTTKKTTTTTKPTTTTAKPTTATTAKPVATTTKAPTTTAPPTSKKLIYGADISGFQNKDSAGNRYDLDWQAIKNSGIEFAIIRAGTTLDDSGKFYSDYSFYRNYDGAKSVGMNIGLYYYCGASTAAGFKQCTAEFLEYIDGRSAEYPVYIDVEAQQDQIDMGKDALTSCLLSSLEMIKNAGYKAGVYASKNWLTNYIDTNAIKQNGYEIWMAWYPNATTPVDPTKYDNSSMCGIWQYSSKGKLPSIISEYVDLDVAYVEYASDLTVHVKELTLYSGDKYTLKPNQTGLTFKSSNTDAAIVSKNGVITAVSPGEAVITVINADSDAVTVKVKVVNTIRGDANKDGKVTVADLVMLQKWLNTASKDLTNAKNADVTGDGRLDAFDLVLLRQLVISKQQLSIGDDFD